VALRLHVLDGMRRRNLMPEALEFYDPTPAALHRQRPSTDDLRRPARSRGETAALLIGRAIFGGFFVYNAVNHFKNMEMMTQYTQSKDVPAAKLAVAISGAMIGAGGLSVLAGVRPKVGASLIAGFLFGVTPIMHAFWKQEDQQQKMNEMVHFSKNVAMLGGALLAAAAPEPWPAAITV
jgi:putative oxidoreductase